MHQTTVRFGPDLWEALEEECGRLGISAAQYVREAALARLSYTAGLRAEPVYGAALAEAGVTAEAAASTGLPVPVDTAVATKPKNRHLTAVSSAQSTAAAAAVSAQSQQVWRRSRQLRRTALELRQKGKET
jgi:hypothetical protein